MADATNEQTKKNTRKSQGVKKKASLDDRIPIEITSDEESPQKQKTIQPDRSIPKGNHNARAALACLHSPPCTTLINPQSPEMRSNTIDHTTSRYFGDANLTTPQNVKHCRI